MPGYWSFTNGVRRVLWRNKKLFLGLTIIYGGLTILLIGLGSQSNYSNLADTLRQTGGNIFEGKWGEIGKASLLLTTVLTGGLNGSVTDIQKFYAGALALMIWLTTVWLLRAILAGQKPRLRDGLYNGGSPIISTFLVSLLLIVQLLPIALAAIGISAAIPSGLLDNGVLSMLFWTVALLLAILSLYWMTSTAFALVVVTLPGMYPMQAIRTAGDLVIGRRIRLLLRLLWMVLIVIVLWLFIMVPIILFDAWLKGKLPAIEWMPIVPAALLVVSSLMVVWTTTYIYLLYRKVVDDDVTPA